MERRVPFPSFNETDVCPVITAPGCELFLRHASLPTESVDRASEGLRKLLVIHDELPPDVLFTAHSGDASTRQ